MQILADLLNTIPAIDSTAMSRAQRHIDGLLKPVGSLGKLEVLAIQLAGMPGLNGIPHVGKKAVLVMCADHGVWEESPGHQHHHNFALSVRHCHSIQQNVTCQIY
jgi:nicotinate-nucleotide--dimethylbenzimidazole phosphoribosyltransferase